MGLASFASPIFEDSLRQITRRCFTFSTVRRYYCIIFASLAVAVILDLLPGPAVNSDSVRTDGALFIVYEYEVEAGFLALRYDSIVFTF